MPDKEVKDMTAIAIPVYTAWGLMLIAAMMWAPTSVLIMLILATMLALWVL